MKFKMKGPSLYPKLTKSPTKQTDYSDIDLEALKSMEAPTYTDTSTDVRVDPDTSVEVKDPDYYYLDDGTKVRKSSGKITRTKGDRITQELMKRNPVATIFTGRK